MISRVELLVNQYQTQVKVDNKVPNDSEVTLVNQLKDLVEKYFTKFAKKQLEISYILWTEAISLEDLASGNYIEADCLEVTVDGREKERQEVLANNLGQLLFFTLQTLAIKAQENQLVLGRFPSEKQLGVNEWKVKNTWFGNSGCLVGKNIIRPNLYYQAGKLIFASSINSPDRITFTQPLKSLGQWVADESQHYMLKITQEKGSFRATLLDTENMLKQCFVNLDFLKQNKIA